MLVSLSFAIAALVLATQSSSDAAARQSLLEATPPDTVLAILADDVPQLRTDFARSAWAELLRAPVFDPVWKTIHTGFEGGVKDAPLEELLAATDAVLIYLTELEEPMEGGMILRLQPYGETTQRAWDFLEAQLPKTGETIREDELEIHLGDEDDEGCLAVARWSQGFLAAQGESRVRAVEQLAAIVRKLEQRSVEDGLAAVLPERGSTPAGAIELYVDLGTLSKRGKSDLSSSDEQVWNLFGLDNLGWCGIQASLGEGVRSEVLAWFELPSKGLLARWAACARTAPVELARFAPADAIEVAVLGFDATSAWRALRAELSESIPTGDKKLQQGLDAATAALGVDLEHDAIDQLTGEFAEVIVPVQIEENPRAWGFGLTPMLLSFSGILGSAPGSAVVVGLRETEPVEALFEKLIEASGRGEEMEDEQVGEHWMTTLALEGAPIRPSWAFVDGALIFSLNAEPLRALLRQANKAAPPSWLEEGHRADLSEFESASCVSAADLQRWLQAVIAVPLSNSMWELELPKGDGPQEPEPEPVPLSWHVVPAICRALPGLVDKHLRGTMRSVVWIEGETLRSRFWSY